MHSHEQHILFTTYLQNLDIPVLRRVNLSA
jgi:hypothetical protein